MPNTRAIRAGRASVEIFADDNPLARGLRSASKRLKRFGDRVRRLGASISKVTALAVAPLGTLSVKQASDAQEITSKFEQVFKKQAENVGKFAEDMARRVGRSSIDIKDSLTSFQAFFVGLGFDNAKAAEFSKSMQQLATDFGSFNNLSDDESLQRFISALAGSSEVLDRFGINTKIAAINQELLRMGINKSAQQATEQEKAVARMNIIMRALGQQGAIGDAIRTSGFFANQMRRLRGNLKDVTIAIGNALLPILNPMLKTLNRIVNSFANWAKRNKELIGTIFKVAAGVFAVGAAITVVGLSITALSVIFGGLGSIVGLAGKALGGVLKILPLIATKAGVVIAAVSGLAAWFLTSTERGQAFIQSLGDGFKKLGDIFTKAWGGIKNAIAAGDLKLAGEIAILGLKVAFQNGLNEINKVWVNFSGFLNKQWVELKFKILGTLDGLWSKIKEGWVDIKNFFTIGFTNIASTTKKVFNHTVNALFKAKNQIKGLFDDSIDVNRLNRFSNKITAGLNNNIDKQSSKKLSELERERNEKIAEIRKDRVDTLKAISDAQTNQLKDIDESGKEAIQQDIKKLGELEKEFQRKIKDAAKARNESDQLDQINAGESRLNKFVPTEGDGLSTITQKLDSLGTFNGSIANRLFSNNNNIQKRAMNANEKTARNTDVIAQALRSGLVTRFT